MSDLDFSVSISGSDSELDDLAEFATRDGIQTERRGMAFNSIDTPSVQLLAFAGAALGVIGRCVTTYLRERKKTLVIMQHEGGKLIIENPTEEQITRALKSAHMIWIHDREPQQKPTDDA